MKVIDHLIKAVRDAAVYNADIQVAPNCILWTDKSRQWEAIIPSLKELLPELLILGDYNPEENTGPAIWLRSVLAGKIKSISISSDLTPILYLPGISRQDLRAVESCPDTVKPLAELQYRGVIWSQLNTKDWTILAFLKSDQGGLGLDVSLDSDSKKAMKLSLPQLINEEYEILEGKRLDKDFFNTMLTGGDPIKDLLLWLNQENGKTNYDAESWNAFNEVCQSLFAFDPQKEGALAGVTRLANHNGPWQAVWSRYCEAPMRYPNIPKQIRKCSQPIFDFFADITVTEGWPQWNDDQEKQLRKSFLSLDKLPYHKAIEKIKELEKEHSTRRNIVWSELGEAPLANTLKYLNIMCENMKNPLAAGTISDLQDGYSIYGWIVDHSVMAALTYIDQKDIDAISKVLVSIYLPWLQQSARYLQQITNGNSYPSGTKDTLESKPCESDSCLLFVDGLRFDIAKQLTDILKNTGYLVKEEISWSALPSITATGKPAVSPVKNKIVGKDQSSDFEPEVSETGQSLKGGYQFKKLLKDSGWTILDHSEVGYGSGLAWCEFGNIDHIGHERGWKISKEIDSLLHEIQQRISTLLDIGWTSVQIVTDHGWLMFPGGLPKIDLPSVLTENKWGRCASLKPGTTTEEKLYPWFWNPNQHFVLANGVSCFKKGEEYAHGGLSLQECLTLKLKVSNGSAKLAASKIEITEITWKGLRCTVSLDGNLEDLFLDVRFNAGDASSSVLEKTKRFKDNGTASTVVEDEEHEGKEAYIIVTDSSGSLLKQRDTIIGGEQND